MADRTKSTGAPPAEGVALTREQVAERFQITTRHLRRLEERHGIPVLRLGRAVRYDAQALAALDEACRAVPEPPVVPLRAVGRLWGPVSSPAAEHARVLKRLAEMAPGRGRKGR